MTLVKICGITTSADAHAAADAGADMLGFNFYRASPRYVSLELARSIIGELPDNVASVGVFVNEPLKSVIESVDLTGIRSVQLHGDEGPEYVDSLRKQCSVTVIKAFRVSDRRSLGTVADYKADAILLDAYTPGEFGGTGNTFEWKLAAEITGRVKQLYLAGGLNVQNVAEAIRQVRPFAVDTASGVESSPGIKDKAKVAAFINAAKSAI